LHFVLDANEYIFAFGLSREEDSELLLDLIGENKSYHSLSICRTIMEEVRVNLAPKDFHTFIRLINLLTTIDEDFVVPFELGSKYESLGLKTADAFIAAYTEWVGADALVTENRHFLRDRKAKLLLD
jgi:predicted nucleic acid-binding protein